MPPISLRKAAMRALLLAGCLLAGGCTTLPRSQLPAAERAELDARFDGSQASAYQVGEAYRRRGDWTALRWYERAAALHSAAAEEQLGSIHASGRLDGDGEAAAQIKPHPRRAYYWYRRSAYHGSPYAMQALVRWHDQQDDTDGMLRWAMRRAVYHRHLYRLAGDRLAPPPGMADPFAAIRRQAERGDAEALVDLGAMYEGGIGVPRDPAAALDCYRRAGEQGNVFGQYFAGLLLGRGPKGVTRDEDEAARWFARAEAQHFYLAGESYWREAIKPVHFTFE